MRVKYDVEVGYYKKEIREIELDISKELYNKKFPFKEKGCDKSV